MHRQVQKLQVDSGQRVNTLHKRMVHCINVTKSLHRAFIIFSHGAGYEYPKHVLEKS